MKRLKRRSTAILIGLLLGWLAAGSVGQWSTFAAEDAPHAAAGDDAHNGHHGEKDEGMKAADLLVPDAGQIPFYKPVVMTAAAFFIAAIGIGLLSRAMGYRDPGIVAGEEDQHDAHHDHDDGHDDDHHGGGGHH